MASFVRRLWCTHARSSACGTRLNIHLMSSLCMFESHRRFLLSKFLAIERRRRLLAASRNTGGQAWHELVAPNKTSLWLDTFCGKQLDVITIRRFLALGKENCCCRYRFIAANIADEQTLTRGWHVIVSSEHGMLTAVFVHTRPFAVKSILCIDLWSFQNALFEICAIPASGYSYWTDLVTRADLHGMHPCLLIEICSTRATVLYLKVVITVKGKRKVIVPKANLLHFSFPGVFERFSINF